MRWRWIPVWPVRDGRSRSRGLGTVALGHDDARARQPRRDHPSLPRDPEDPSPPVLLDARGEQSATPRRTGPTIRQKRRQRRQTPMPRGAARVSPVPQAQPVSTGLVSAALASGTVGPSACTLATGRPGTLLWGALRRADDRPPQLRSLWRQVSFRIVLHGRTMPSIELCRPDGWYRLLHSGSRRSLLQGSLHRACQLAGRPGKLRKLRPRLQARAWPAARRSVLIQPRVAVPLGPASMKDTPVRVAASV